MRSVQLTLGNNNNIFLFYSTVLYYIYSLFVSRNTVFCVLIFLVLFVFVLIHLLFSITVLAPFYVLYLFSTPGYPNIVNLFLTYIHTHVSFFFYSNRINSTIFIFIFTGVFLIQLCFKRVGYSFFIRTYKITYSQK